MDSKMARKLDPSGRANSAHMQADTEIAKTRSTFNPLFLFCLDIKNAL
jgi:hypothetical protein